MNVLLALAALLVLALIFYLGWLLVRPEKLP